MNFLRFTIPLAACVALALGIRAQDTEDKKDAPAKPKSSLAVGDSAPPLTLAKTVKGKEPKAEDRSKTYVVEFWATWCPPCRTSIPHLTELQKKHPKIPFIGVTDEEEKDVEPFVKDMGAKMDYTVVIDKDRATNAAWMQAAGEEGIPAAFVVVEGKVAFIGHPMNPEFEQTLTQVSAGKFDLAAAVKKGAVKARLKQAQVEAISLIRSGKADEAVKALDKAFEIDPEAEKTLGPLKFQILVFTKKEPEALAYAGKMTTTFMKDEPEQLNRFAWNFIDPARTKNPTAFHAKVAVILAEAADKAASGKDANILDTLALARFHSGDKPGAVKTQEQAIKVAGDGPKTAEMRKRLEEFRKAASE